MQRIFIIFSILLLTLTACSGLDSEEEPPTPLSYGAALDMKGQWKDLEREKSIWKKEQYPRLRIVAVGDLLMHLPVINDAAEGGGTFDFTHQFREVQPIIAGADLALANLETTFTGPQVPYHGFPRFNAPDDLADDLKRIGFDVITTANNHSLDGGIRGLDRTRDVLEKAGLQATGTYRPSDPPGPLRIERGPVTIGILNYTYGTNGLPIPADRPGAVNLIETDRILREVESLSDVDLVIAALHFGHEYHLQPSEEQVRLVHILQDAGVDLILGAHPHVLQPAEQTAPDRFVIYSMGNFLSNQRKRYQDAGVIVDLKVTFDRQKGRKYIRPTLHPTWVERRWGSPGTRYRILPIEPFLEDPALDASSREKLRSVYQDSLRILNDRRHLTD